MSAAIREPRGPGPGRVRAVLVVGSLAAGAWFLASRAETGEDEAVTTAGRLEVTARLLERPEVFPDLGAYRYTWVLEYEVLRVHRQAPDAQHAVHPGDRIFAGHYKPWLPRSRIKDRDWGEGPLGGNLERFTAGDAHRMALDYELGDLAPSGVLDYCFPRDVKRFFAVWTNRADL